MPEVEDEWREIRTQRHDFIKEYYKMAVADLDRHLKGGWQTIAVLAGGAAVLAAGHDQKIGMPIAVAISLVTAFWGLLNIVDANFWALRAVAFLSNVEAIYFSAEDRKVFNPYVGHHPKYQLMDSLRYLFWLSCAFAVLSVCSLIWEILLKYPALSQMWFELLRMSFLKRILWTTPLLVFCGGSYLVVREWERRLRDYVRFVTSTPGPGVRAKTSEGRHVTLEPLAGRECVSLESEVVSSRLAELVRSAECWKDRLDALRAVTFVLFLMYVVFNVVLVVSP